MQLGDEIRGLHESGERPTLEELLQQLASGDDGRSPELIEAIEARGDEAIEPLLQLVRKEIEDPGKSPNVDLAIGMLGDLRAGASIPDLLELIRRGSFDELDWLPDSLVSIGNVPHSELEAMVRDISLAPNRRMMAAEIFALLAPGTPEAPGPAQHLFLELLENGVRRARVLSARERDMAGFLVYMLAEDAVPAARPIIDAAFDAGIVPSDFVRRDEVDGWYEEGSRGDHSEDREDDEEDTDETFLSRYRRLVVEGECDWEDEDLDAEGFDDRDETDYSGPGRFVPSTAPIRSVKVGRNEPCPCGSGKKFKKCCLGKEGQDEAPESSSGREARPSDPLRPLDEREDRTDHCSVCGVPGEKVDGASSRNPDSEGD